MLTELNIENFALIEKLKIRFEKGLNVITGVTGSGKSIIIGALELALGGKVSEEMLRSGESRLAVEASFEITDFENLPELADVLDNSDNGQMLTIRREYRKKGGNKVQINGKPVTLTALKAASDRLASILGQHSHQSLLDPSSHIGYLDSYGVPEELSARLKSQYLRAVDIKERIAYSKRHAREIAERIELLKFQIGEIESVSPKSGEEDGLKNRKSLLESAERIKELGEMVAGVIVEADDSVLEKIGELERVIDELPSGDSHIENVRGLLSAGTDSLREAVSAARNLADKIENNPDELESVNERLYEIHRLKKKYGGSLEAVLQYADDSRKELDTITGKGGSVEELEAEFKSVERALNKTADEVSGLRLKAKTSLEKMISDNLAKLGMPKAQFEVRLNLIEDENGLYLRDGRRFKGDFTGPEQVEFQFCANPGEGLKPLARIASGGEISRVMLALKNVFIDRQSGGCEVFDEIDVGISGEVAAKIAAQLKELSAKHQVICITHLHQIASAADHHFKVYKEKTGRRSVTMIKKLDKEERINEIAAFLSGRKITDKALEGAREIIEDSSR